MGRIERILKKILPPSIDEFNKTVDDLRVDIHSVLQKLSELENGTGLIIQALKADQVQQVELLHMLYEKQNYYAEQLCELTEDKTRQTQFLQGLSEIHKNYIEQLRMLSGMLQTQTELMEIMHGEQMQQAQIVQKLYTQQNNFYQDYQRQLESEREERSIATERLIASIWDSRNKALWETKDEISLCANQFQQLYWYHRAIIEGMSLEETKQNFFQTIPKAEGKLRIIQNMELFLLKNFKRICDENGLHYWLQGGTLLGAIRHKGFVPWDDDLDVSMLRVDFERLVVAIKNSKQFAIEDYYQIQDRTWQSRISKFICPYSKTNIFIDIFVFDDIFCKEGEESLLYEHVFNTKVALQDAIERLVPDLKEAYHDVPIKDLADKNKVDELFDHYTRQAAEWTGSASDSKVLFWSVEYCQFSLKRIYRDKTIFPTRLVQFEDEFFQVPNDADAYLRAEYKDYYNLPMDIGRLPHWDIFSMDEQVDTAKSFLEHINAKK